MPLKIVATPIGNPEDLTYRAHKILQEADVIVGEERKELFRFLKSWKIEAKQTELLNEHSKPHDLEFLVELCRDKQVALVSDAGTPAFCDPGADLVRVCRARGIAVEALPGASSLMVFLSLLGRRLDKFFFQGFLPKDQEERNHVLRQIARSSWPVIAMDTPYRLEKILGELSKYMPERQGAVGMNLTMPEERWEYGTFKDLSERVKGIKAEFLIYIEAGAVGVKKVSEGAKPAFKKRRSPLIRR